MTETAANTAPKPSAGREFAKHPSLRAALRAAALDVGGLVEKSGWNKEHKYAYAGHQHVLEHVREVMLEHGVIVEPKALRFAQAVTWSDGKRVVFVWEQVTRISHVDSADSFEITIHVTTHAGDKASGIASTAADRELLTRLMRLGSADYQEPDSQPDYDQETGEVHRRTRQQQQASQGGTQHRETSAVERIVKTILDELPKVPTDPPSLGGWYRNAGEQLRRINAPDTQWKAIDAAFGTHCKKLNLDPHQVANARTPTTANSQTRSAR